MINTIVADPCGVLHKKKDWQLNFKDNLENIARVMGFEPVMVTRFDSYVWNEQFLQDPVSKFHESKFDYLLLAIPPVEYKTDAAVFRFAEKLDKRKVVLLYDGDANGYQSAQTFSGLLDTISSFSGQPEIYDMTPNNGGKTHRAISYLNGQDFYLCQHHGKGNEGLGDGLCKFCDTTEYILDSFLRKGKIPKNKDGIEIPNEQYIEAVKVMSETFGLNIPDELLDKVKVRQRALRFESKKPLILPNSLYQADIDPKFFRDYQNFVPPMEQSSFIPAPRFYH